MITDNDGRSGRGFCVKFFSDAVLLRHIKPESHPTARRHHQVEYHKGDSNWTAVTPSPRNKSKLFMNKGFLSFYPINWFAKNCWFEPNRPSFRLLFLKLQVI